MYHIISNMSAFMKKFIIASVMLSVAISVAASVGVSSPSGQLKHNVDVNPDGTLL